MPYEFWHEGRFGFIAFSIFRGRADIFEFHDRPQLPEIKSGDAKAMPEGWDHGAGIAYRSDTKESGSPGDHEYRDIIRADNQIFHF